jgi:predicted anti-sigma-YlaC factor YlaD
LPIGRNFPPLRRDDREVNCATCREALSARLDGEDEPVPADLVDGHLAGCSDCQRWQTSLTAITRSIRVRPAAATPDLTDRILAAAVPEPPAHRSDVLRWALGVVAFIQLCLALAQLLGIDHTSHLAAGTGEHLFNESTAWNLGVAIGLLVAAVRPAFARGLLPALAVFVVVLVAVSVADVLAGSVGVDRLASHVMVVVGLALLFLVDRQYRRSPGPGRNAMPVSSDHLPVGREEESPPADPGTAPRSGRWLRPAGRHAA